MISPAQAARAGDGRGTEPLAVNLRVAGIASSSTTGMRAAHSMPTTIERAFDEMRDSAVRIGRRVQFMEVCGTHTVSMFRHGLRAMLPANVRLVSGPGCPVCVTAQRHIDAAIQLGEIEGVVVATYGDMLRVPGALGSLQEQRARGVDVRVVNSARTALRLAREHPERTVVFVGVGFETTAPATAAVILEADREGMANFAVLASHKLVVPAMLALLRGGNVALDGFLCPGHVSVITGSEVYRPVVERFHQPCVVAGFEPTSIVEGLLRLLRQVEHREACLENAYRQAVSPEGNVVAQRLLREVFEVVDTPWRALGVISASGLGLRAKYRRFDATDRFDLTIGKDSDHPACRCGEVICGSTMPDECQLFGTACTPMRPLGPCMVSSEGTCSAWYKYNRAASPRTSPCATGVNV